jgi:alpha-mannosidase
LINDGCHGADFLDGALRLSLLRSPAYSAHPIPDRPVVPPGRFTPRIDQGERLFRFWLQGGPAAQLLAGIDRESAIRNEKPLALSCFPSGGGTPRGAFCEVDDPAIRMSCLKRGEEGGLVVRLYETTGTARAATICFPWCEAQHLVRFAPFEIQTLRFDPVTGRFESIAPMDE